MKRILYTVILTFILGLSAAPLAQSADTVPEKLLSQFIHTEYKDKGFQEVLCLLQDKTGYIWIGTYSGLVRFDGTDFEMFNTYSRKNFPVRSVRALAEDQQGGMWIGTNEDGLVRYSNGSCVVYDTGNGLPNNSVRRLRVDQQGRVWIGTAAGLCMFDGRELKKFEPIELQSTLINFILQDTSGSIWVGANTNDSLFRLKAGTSVFEKVSGELPAELAGKTVSFMIEDTKRKANWFVAGNQAYLVRKGAVVKTLDFRGLAGSETADITEAYEDKDGSIWFFNTLFRYADNSIHHFDKMSGLGDDRASTILQDREGNLWIGTQLGLQKYTEPRFVSYGQPEGLSCPAVNAVMENRPGEYWLGTDEGIYILNVARGNSVTVLSDPRVKVRIRHLMKESTGMIWASTYGNGLVGLRDGRVVKNIRSSEGLAGDKVRLVVEDRSHNLWVGTTTGLSLIRPDGKIQNINARSGMTNEYIMCIQEAADGVMWIGTDGGGINIIEHGQIVKTYTRKDSLPTEIVLRLYRNDKGTLFAATTGGITRFDQKGLTSYTFKDLGINPQDNVFQILADTRNRLWMITSSGVYCMNREMIEKRSPGAAGGKVRYFKSASSGLREGPSTTAWAITDHQGAFWIPTFSGVARVDPLNMYLNTTPPQVVIKQTLLDNQDTGRLGNQIELSADNMRIDFSYAALSFVDPEQTLTRYMLEGFDHNWSNYARRNEATYTNLSPGTYRFKVSAVNGDGVASRQIAVIKVVKLPHFYETAWFRILASIILLGLLGLLFRKIYLRRVAHLTEKVEHQEEQLHLERRATESERQAKEKEIELNRAISSFVPMAFLNFLGKRSITEIRPGNYVEKEITVLFTDVRSFTQMSEMMESTEIFQVINQYLQFAVGSITKHGGFIDKFIGDAVMGLFPGAPDQALMAIIDLYAMLRQYNDSQAANSGAPVRIGAGIHRGSVTLGTIGTDERMDTTVIGDIVNLASRIESATKTYQVDIMISDAVYDRLENPENFSLRAIDTVRVKGKLTVTTLYEVMDCDDPAIREKKLSYLPEFNQAIKLYKEGDFEGAITIFKACQEICPEDKLLPIYIKRCSTLIRIPPGPDWAGVSGL